MELQRESDILVLNFNSDLGVSIMRDELRDLPEWITLGEASKYVDVTRETLRRMIKDDNDERIPVDCWRKISVGSRPVYQIRTECLDDIEFGTVGRPPKNSD